MCCDVAIYQHDHGETISTKIYPLKAYAIRNDRFMISDDMQQCAEWAVHPSKLGAGDNPAWPPA